MEQTSTYVPAAANDFIYGQNIQTSSTPGGEAVEWMPQIASGPARRYRVQLYSHRSENFRKEI